MTLPSSMMKARLPDSVAKAITRADDGDNRDVLDWVGRPIQIGRSLAWSRNRPVA